MSRVSRVHQKTHCERNFVFIGFGSIGQALLAPLFEYFDITPERVVIITGDDRGKEIAKEFSVAFHISPLTRENFRVCLAPHVSSDTFVINVSVDVSTVDIVGFCQERGALYIDTVIEPWPGRYASPKLPPGERSNYVLREEALALRKQSAPGSPTAILTHGANPGIVSHFVKQALLDIAGHTTPEPTSRSGWAALSRDLGIRVIHIAERDSQLPAKRRTAGEFTNTWSVDGFISEGLQPAELGWGSHERSFPADAQTFDFGCRSAIYLNQPGMSTRVRSYTPLTGPQTAYLITHGESISIADYLSVVDMDDRVVYRPTVLYAYRPNDDALLSVAELQEREWVPQERRTVITDKIKSGVDALGVLLMGHNRKSYWYGSLLSINEARRIAPHNNATSLQVIAGIISAIVWALRNPAHGIVEPDEMPHREILATARPYLGTLFGTDTDWTPLHGRQVLFPQDADMDDPWQFKNFRIS